MERVNNYLVPLAVAVFVCMAHCSAVADQVTSRQQAMVMAKVLTKYGSMQTLTATGAGRVKVDASGFGVAGTFRSSIIVARPKLLYCDASVTPQGGRRSRGIASTDGSRLWDYDPMSKQFSEQSLASVASSRPDPSDWLMDRVGLDVGVLCFLKMTDTPLLKQFKDVSAPDDLRGVPFQTFNGQPMYVLTVIVPPGPDGATSTAKLYIDQASLLIRRAVYTKNSGKDAPIRSTTVIDVSYEDIKVDGSLQGTVFAFVPPPGGRKVDKVGTVFDRAFQ